MVVWLWGERAETVSDDARCNVGARLVLSGRVNHDDEQWVNDKARPSRYTR